MRKLKGLEEYVDVVWLHWKMGPKGWFFEAVDNSTDKDPYYGFKYLQDFYFKAKPDYDKRFTVPMLWDKKLETIVNNESSEIIRNFNTCFNAYLPLDKAKLDFYPEELRADIDAIDELIYNTVNNGVYKAGFATVQEAYEENVFTLFESLDKLEKILDDREFLIGPGKGVLTEADVRLYVTIVRFDVAYHNLFKCNIKMIRHDYPNLHRWLRHLYYDFPEEFKDTTFLEQTRNGYAAVNSGAVVPAGPLPLMVPRQTA